MKFINLFSSIIFSVASLLAQAQEPMLQGGDSLINTRWNEAKPMLSPKGDRFYFSRANDAANVGGRKDRGDVLYINLEGSKQLPQRISSFNTKFTDMVAGFSADGSSIYIAHNDEDALFKKTANLFKYATDGTGAQEVEIAYFYNKAKHQDITISPDGKTMILSLESYSTYGLEDLYVSFLQNNGNWSEPRNLGNQINSTLQEMGGFLAEDGRTLYYVSNRLGGIGSLDIYQSTRLDDTWKNWSEPQNLGLIVNSTGAESFYYMPTKGNWSYYTSTQNSEGFGDIKRIKKPEPPQVEPLLVDSATVIAENIVEEIIFEREVIEEPLASEVIDININEEEQSELRFAGSVVAADNNQIFGKLVIEQLNGSYRDSASAANSFYTLLPEPGRYKVSVYAKGYFGKDSVLTIYQDINSFSITLDPIIIGKTVRLENVMFQKSTAILLEDSYPTLDLIAKMMADNIGMEILLSGHTDNQGSSRANIKLSKERVEAVEDYLVSRGIEESRIKGKGYGGTKPVASNAGEATRKLNRRVEFTVLKND